MKCLLFQININTEAKKLKYSLLLSYLQLVYCIIHISEHLDSWCNALFWRCERCSRGLMTSDEDSQQQEEHPCIRWRRWCSHGEEGEDPVRTCSRSCCRTCVLWICWWIWELRCFFIKTLGHFLSLGNPDTLLSWFDHFHSNFSHAECPYSAGPWHYGKRAATLATYQSNLTAYDCRGISSPLWIHGCHCTKENKPQRFSFLKFSCCEWVECQSR